MAPTRVYWDCLFLFVLVILKGKKVSYKRTVQKLKKILVQNDRSKIKRPNDSQSESPIFFNIPEIILLDDKGLAGPLCSKSTVLVHNSIISAL
jgi:hypothetical protein